MRVKTTRNDLKQSVKFTSLIPGKAEDMQVKSFTDDSGKTETKTAPDGSGRVQHRTQLKALALDEDGNAVREERDVTVSLLEPANVEIGKYYDLDGDIWVTHYMNNGRMGVSIVAETIVPSDESKSTPKPSITGNKED